MSPFYYDGRLEGSSALLTPIKPRILAIIVLYKVHADVSPAFQTLRQLLADDPAATLLIDLIVCDNTPAEQPAPTSFDGTYIRYPGNPGLAKAYNTALRIATERDIPWLLLLDQDTTLTAGFIAELTSAAETLLPQTEIVAIVPKLFDKGVVVSPHYPPVFEAARPVPLSLSGIAPDNVYVFNSGALVRVSALNALGGFAEDFPLDFLDHVTFAALRRAGGKLFILNAVLGHELSDVNQATPDPAIVPRQLAVLDAEYRFLKTYGSPKDRLLRRLRLLRSALGRTAKGKDWGQTRRILQSAFRL